MTIANYYVHGVCLESNVDFPELLPSPFGHPEVALSVKHSTRLSLRGLPETTSRVDGFYYRPDGGRESFTMYGYDSHYVLRWRSLCDFQVSRDGSQIDCYPWPGVSWSNITPFLLGRVLPLALNFRGIVTLHAGAVVLPSGAIAFVADSGTGKSTLVASLASRGFPLVADDVLAVRTDPGRVCVFPGSSKVRLTQESLSFLAPTLPLSSNPEPDYDKTRVYLRDQGNGIGPSTIITLRATYFLVRSPEKTKSSIEISTVPPQEALMLLLTHTTNVSLLEPRHVAEQFLSLSKLVCHVPAKRVEYPSDLRSLPDVCAALLEDQGVALTSVLG